MGVTTTNNKPLNPRGNDQSPLAYNKAAIYSGKALDFDGVNDYVDGGTLGITGYTQMSISFYMNVDTTTQDFRLISIKYIGVDDIRIFHSVSVGAGVLNFSLDDGDVDNIGVNFETNKWYHVVMTHDGTTLKAYFNGIEQASTASTFDYANANGLFYIGRYTGGAVTFYDGEASNVKIFNTALTAAQVADLYNNPEKIVPTGVANTALKLWLPMQEGAGTTAYDGSGNGNHGTISGATYVHGIGAPVAQTAVISWNKGTNLVTYSEELENSSWTKSGTTANDGESDPLSTSRATELTENSASAEHVLISNSISITSGTQYYISVLAKQGSGSRYLGFAGMGLAGASESPIFDLQNGSVDLGASSTIAKSASIEAYGSDGWYKCSMVLQSNSTASLALYFTLVSTANDNGLSGYNYTGNGTSSVFLFAPMFKVGSAEGVYIQTIATTQPSPVLLPQGLTTGRDITGVNLFENVRKQGALNLDGNSWAEVHDNASLDVNEITAEGWMYAENITTINNRIVNKWNAAYPERSFQLYGQNNTINWMLSDGSAAYSITGGTLTQGQWFHVVGTYDGSTQKIYLDGVQVATTALSITLKQSSFKVMLGGYTTGLYSLNPIAQPRIYNRALTAEEIQRNYDAGKNIYS